LVKNEILNYGESLKDEDKILSEKLRFGVFHRFDNFFKSGAGIQFSSETGIMWLDFIKLQE
jgi:hypothetical protein